jgi:hypothetical protein
LGSCGLLDSCASYLGDSANVAFFNDAINQIQFSTQVFHPNGIKMSLVTEIMIQMSDIDCELKFVGQFDEPA